ncbi:MAG: DUF2652 domain-containing protein [Armatimonadota bacterium]|nr:DUF2652 domain-containing protein [Armatimonadota bacterium]MDR7533374.1 DUF2652 domain-containing protein [Armatimonadota bacterium]MDR7536494.1 DUF2652 domain-containing protein [Armatimonadota bacterium]
MLSEIERGCLVLTDITGYTRYLAGTELEHAQDVLADLMTTVVGALRPPLRLAKLEGDAVFAYAPAGRLDGPTLLDLAESCYFRFRRRLRDIRQATTCQCNACRQMPLLDLKLFAHDGEFVRQRVAGREELAGADVILLHRLLKNSVAETLRLQGYALFTEACVRAMQVDPATTGMREHVETHEHLGAVRTFVQDLHVRWAEEQERQRVYIGPGQAELELPFEIPAAPPVVWDYLTSPARRMRYQPGTHRIDQQNPRGRRGPGTTNHCVHGHQVIVEEILDWRPFHYFTVRFVVMEIMLEETVELAAVDDGTRVTLRTRGPRAGKARQAWESLREQHTGYMREVFAQLAAVVQEETAGG